MKRFLVSLLGLFLLAGPASADSRNLVAKSADASGKRVALVIGNAKYVQSPLKNPANDARDMARALRGLGFDVIEKTDVTQKEMNRAITQFGEKLGGDSVALFFYAGHGMQVKGKNYLVPIDAQIASESSVRSEAVDVDTLLDQLGNSALNVVILDACRNNPFERRFRSVGGGLAQMEAPKGTLIAYATAPGKTAADGEGRNGLYTAELLKLMQTPGLPVEAVFKRVRGNVAKATGDNQIPWESSSLTGDFYFRPAGIAPAAVPATQAVALPQGADVELRFWESAEKGDSPADYEAYLRKFPQGQFADLAQIRLAKVSAEPQQTPAADLASFKRSGPVNTPAPPKEGDYWRYRGSNPLGADSPTYRVSKVGPGIIELSFTTNNNDATTLVLNSDWNPVEQRGGVDMKFKPFMPQFSFPLEPGKKWRAHYEMDCGFLCDVESDFEGEVRGWEKITVPAGTFDTLRIDYRDATSQGTGFGSIWYSPIVRRYVKQEYQMAKMRYYYELEAYQLASPQPMEQKPVADAPPGRLVVYRESAFLSGTAVVMTVTTDGRRQGSLMTGNYLVIDATPGSRKLTAHVEVNRGSCSLDVNVESGRSYYFKTDVSWESGCELVPVQEEGGQREISRLVRKN